MKKFRFLFIALFIALVACTQETGKSSDGRVAAMVNGVEITKRQVDYIYKRSATTGMSEAESANLKRRILSDLVRVELFAGKAKEMQLDQGPDYAMALYASQKTMLAGFAEKKLAGNPSISPQEAEVIVKNNPQIFSGRKIFFYDEIVIPGVDQQLLESLSAKVKNGSSLSQLLDELKTRKLPFNQAMKSLTSENIPPVILSILNRLQPGRPQLINAGNKVTIILCIRYADFVPLLGEQARNSAISLIAQQQRTAALSKSMNDLLNSAKITYYDEYSVKVTGNQQQSALPVPDVKKTQNKLGKTILAGVGLFLQLILSVMALTALMRSFYSKLWLPRLWPDYEVSDETRGSFHTRYQASLLTRFYLAGMTVLIIGTLGVEMRFLLGKTPIWMIPASMLAGAGAGIFLSRLYSLEVFRKWPRKNYLIALAVLTMPILAVALFILRLGTALRAL
ncbi:MAG: peptidyl-prolyl cis-trans isomerase, EpsD family [Chlorobiaceae bacterium]|nr:peptidyl-prolyl cis-trans isomerase, EpsD family [Chlorobiaceae bacterium]